MNENIFAHMEFVRREQQTEEPRTEEKRICREEFEQAVRAAAEKLIADPKVEGMSKMMIPLMGTVFARTMEEILFGKKEG